MSMLGGSGLFGGVGGTSAAGIAAAIANATNTKIVYPTDDLSDAYDWIKSTLRNDKMGALTEDNPRLLLLMPGVHTLSATLELCVGFVTIMGLSPNTVITYAGAGHTIHVMTSYPSLRNLRILQTSGNAAYEALHFGAYGYTYEVLDVATSDSAYGEMYFADEAPYQGHREQPVMVLDPDFFTAGWVREPVWKGSISHVAEKTPWNSNGYVLNTAHADFVGMICCEVQKDFSAAPLDYSNSAIVFAYTIQPQNNDAFYYKSSSSDGGWVTFIDGSANEVAQAIGMPTIPGRHICIIPCTYAGIDYSDIVAINISFKSVTTGITENLPAVQLEDWGVINTAALSPRIAIQIDDGFQRSVDNLIWPMVHAGLKSSFAVRFDMIGDENMVTWDVLKALQDTGLVEISPHISAWPGDKSLKRQLDYIRFSKQIFRAHGFAGAGLDIYVIPQGTGGSTGKRPSPTSFNLMRSYFKYFRGIQPFITGNDGTVSQVGPSMASGTIPGKYLFNGFLPASTMDTARIGSSAGSDTSKFLDTGGHMDRIVAANMTGLYYCHNVSDSETINTLTLDNLKKSEAEDLVSKLSTLKSGGTEIIFVSEI